MINWEYLHNKLIEEKKVENKGKGIEEHHIIPKHDKGTDEKSNLVYLSRRYHILIHYIRWRWLKHIYDKVAYCMMFGKIINPMQDPEFVKYFKENCITLESRKKMSDANIKRNQDLVYKKKHSLAMQNYVDSLTIEERYNRYKHFIYPSPELLIKLQESKIKWFATKTKEEILNRFKTSPNEGNPNWTGGYKLINEETGINFIFYTKKELCKLTKLGTHTILKHQNTNIPMTFGKWNGFKLFKSKELLQLTIN